MALIRIANGSKVVATSPSISLLNALLRDGVPIRHDCGGKAQCGTCRLKIISGASGLSPILPREAERLAALPRDEVRSDDPELRLACQAHAAKDVEIEIIL